jgi:hypothetical protein
MGKQAELQERWRQRITDQEESGLSIRAYCKEHGFNEHSFYSWRLRMRGDGPVSFALVDSKPAARVDEGKTLELVLEQGERLRIPCDEASLGLVLRALRALR